MHAQHKPKLITGLADIEASYDAFIIDIWGVIHNGVTPYPGTQEFLDGLFRTDKKIVFLSNTSMMSDEIEQSLYSMGLNPKYYSDAILTAGDSAHEQLKNNFSGERCFYLGAKPSRSMFQGLDMNFVDHVDEATYILNTIGWSYHAEGKEKLLFEALEKAINKNIPMICSNPDLYVEVGGDIGKCAGFYADWYERNGGQVHWHGKPFAPIYELAWARLGKVDKSKICAIGDSLRTDIAGAEKFGIDSIWNLAGTTKDLTLNEAYKTAQKTNLNPTYIMRGTSW